MLSFFLLSYLYDQSQINGQRYQDTIDADLHNYIIIPIIIVTTHIH